MVGDFGDSFYIYVILITGYESFLFIDDLEDFWDICNG